MLNGLKNSIPFPAGNFLDFTKANPIGLDFGREKLNMVQINYKGDLPSIQAACSDYHNSSIDAFFAEPTTLQPLIKSAFKKNPFKGRKVVASMPSSKLKLLFLNYRCKNSDNESEALLAALKERQGKELIDAIIDYVPINPDTHEQDERIALVAIAKQQDVEIYLDLLNQCGLQVAALEIGPVAIKRLINLMSQRDNTQKTLTLNFGTEKSYLTVLWEGNILLDREISFGINSVLKMAAEGLEIKPADALNLLHQYGLTKTKSEAEEDQLNPDFIDDDIRSAINEILKPAFVDLATEIRDVLVYVASETRGGAIEQIYLLGSLARISGIDQLFDSHVSVPVKTINPFYGLEVLTSKSKFDDIGPLSGIAVATGLALREDSH